MNIFKILHMGIIKQDLEISLGVKISDNLPLAHKFTALIMDFIGILKFANHESVRIERVVLYLPYSEFLHRQLKYTQFSLTTLEA